MRRGSAALSASRSRRAHGESSRPPLEFDLMKEQRDSISLTRRPSGRRVALKGKARERIRVGDCPPVTRHYDSGVNRSSDSDGLSISNASSIPPQSYGSLWVWETDSVVPNSIVFQDKAQDTPKHRHIAKHTRKRHLPRARLGLYAQDTHTVSRTRRDHPIESDSRALAQGYPVRGSSREGSCSCSQWYQNEREGGIGRAVGGRLRLFRPYSSHGFIFSGCSARILFEVWPAGSRIHEHPQCSLQRARARAVKLTRRRRMRICSARSPERPSPRP